MNGSTEASMNSSVNEDEKNYLKQIERILSCGDKIVDRTNVGTLSIFGVIPLLTTKRVFWKGIVEELLWFIRSETNSKSLSDKGVKIWDANGSRAFLDSNGFHDRSEGDLGPIYGFQWRHFGAEYRSANDDYSNEGIDQLSEVINQIKNSPHSRRIILNSWNVKDLKKMVLPPCHVMAQFCVRNGELSCQLYQRSGDMGLGVPFNIASYSLLTHMVAHLCQLKTGFLHHVIGDAHIYMNHVDALKEQLKREPRSFPKLTISGEINSIDDFESDSFILENYNPMPAIKMEMAV